ncbi:KasA/KasB family beta-ketoacyl-ACP synthase [Mycolicibacterium vaccae]|uniref:KasA/KasB family beta-ketoacyl-ACP synthase n=1 Tax=Mycolicibacterium vaccae TaxID=1810 RepID=UPI0002F18551|nr:KasA/KasB family beta-ketoacyl-ACP synthase [Mycolicibacterium vaccae]MCV7062860.1 beta-ketoacyl-ACP synthase [Mycolicibacterium vaccae]
MSAGPGDGRPGVVVTAVAATTALATDAEETWAELLAGRSGIRALDAPFVAEFDLPVGIGGAVAEDFDAELNRVEIRRLSYMQKMALVLNRRLWAAADSPEIDTTRLLVSISHAFGSTRDLVTAYDDFRSRGMRAVSPLAVQMHMPNAPAAAVGLDRQAKAGVIAPMAADASGAAAVAEAWRLITLGEADAAICGGVESRIEAVPIAAFHNQGLLAHDNEHPAAACKPFDKSRDGMVFGEAGALLLLESEEHARARNAPVLARMMGVGVTADAHHMIEADPDGELAAAAITRAMRTAGVQPDEVDHVNAHAAGTRGGDLSEARALRKAFGSHNPAVWAPKAALGHSMGAAGALEAILTVQALRDSVVPPTLNLEIVDPEIDLDIVAGEPRRGPLGCAMSGTFGFGGHNVALIFGSA